MHPLDEEMTVEYLTITKRSTYPYMHLKETSRSKIH